MSNISFGNNGRTLLVESLFLPVRASWEGLHMGFISEVTSEVFSEAKIIMPAKEDGTFKAGLSQSLGFLRSFFDLTRGLNFSLPFP
jgi:hypothetical protein